MGGFQRSLMSFIGLGSVSDHCCHNMPCPTLVVRGEDAVLSRGLMQADEAHPPQSAQPKRVMVCCDDSPHAHAGLLWALDNTLLPNDHLVLAAVATPVPFPVLDEPATVAAMQSAQYREAAATATAAAQDVAERCAAVAQRRGVGKTKITTVSLPPGGSAGDVGAALCKHAKVRYLMVFATSHSSLLCPVGHLSIAAPSPTFNFLSLTPFPLTSSWMMGPGLSFMSIHTPVLPPWPQSTPVNSPAPAQHSTYIDLKPAFPSLRMRSSLPTAPNLYHLVSGYVSFIAFLLCPQHHPPSVGGCGSDGGGQSRYGRHHPQPPGPCGHGIRVGFPRAQLPLSARGGQGRVRRR
ncbi:hypothetical protein Vafri_9166 [Volvox africanus]|nr:hypothetical protein Vafri_9166 [Volvox africanus]